MTKNTNHYTMHYSTEPSAYFTRYVDQLVQIGADAFGQPPETFGAQVAERFAKSEIAQIMQHQGEPVGFALYTILPSCHWQSAFRRG